MGGQLSSEQSQLNHFPATSFGVEGQQQIPGVLSGSSQLPNPLFEGFQTDSQVGALSFPRLNLAQSSSSSFPPFELSAPATLGVNYSHNLDANHSNQVICKDMDMQWSTECSLGNTSMTESSINPAQELGSSENPIDITENPGMLRKASFP